ncbi:hypothetical protein ACWGJB_30970 [Streptomyces sp. NPDC054813]
MTDHDIQLLAIGTTLGIYLMLFVQVVGGILDDRRDRKVARAAQAQLDAARERAEA